MAFRVGQKVVCINVRSWNSNYFPCELIKGEIYTIAGFGEHSDFPGRPGVHLVEVPIRRFGSNEPFSLRRFRPIVERKTDISCLKALLVPGAKIREKVGG